ncbi:Gibberellin 2-beta-dioxygenase 8 [Platanthera guangdongensis]|uniref:Gibberellin 2-beta-dioxygenase 8 n=1 Tax=Platanthera guangdongensis TaxID=2320717 RepID=A0ABR2LV02_9ASPA
MSKSGTGPWAVARAEVARAWANYGGFVVVSDGIKPEMQDELFGRVMPELFMESNLRGPTLLNYDGAWIQRDAKILPFKSLKVTDPVSVAAVHECATNIWPHGNEIFRNNIWSYSKQMKGLMQIIHKMVLESLELEHHYGSHLNSLQYSLRLSEYSIDENNEEDRVVIPPHADPNFVSIICQDKKGLEVEASTGEWMEAPTAPNSFTVLLGEIFTAWTNGVFRAPKHRVRTEQNAKRRSAVFNAFPSLSEEIMLETPHELVDEKHPLLFNPFNYYNYIKFRHSDEGEKHKNVLEAYCGVKPAIATA